VRDEERREHSDDPYGELGVDQRDRKLAGGW
jgi:hypothetical protein